MYQCCLVRFSALKAHMYTVGCQGGFWYDACRFNSSTRLNDRAHAPFSFFKEGKNMSRVKVYKPISMLLVICLFVLSLALIAGEDVNAQGRGGARRVGRGAAVGAGAGGLMGGRGGAASGAGAGAGAGAIPHRHRRRHRR